MSATATTLRKPAATPFVIVNWTQHWSIIDGAYYRDAVVRLADGSRRIYSFLEDEAVAA